MNVDMTEKYEDSENINATLVIQFKLLNAENENAFFEANYFDLIVSFETIEHLKNPELYLKNLKKWLKKDGVIIISCPNDNWYYKDGTGNPFHEKKYTYEQFKEICESILGNARSYAYGMPIVGYANITKTDSIIKNMSNEKMSNLFNFKHSESLHIPSFHEINNGNVSYFIGIWGPEEIGVMNTACYYGTSMDESRIVAHSEYVKLQDELLKLKMKSEISKEDFEGDQNTETNCDQEKSNITINRLMNEVDFLKKQIIISYNDQEKLVDNNKKYISKIHKLEKELAESGNYYFEVKKLKLEILENSKDAKRILELEELIELDRREYLISLEKVKREVELLLNSKSWKITSPLRWIFNKFRSGR